MKFSQLFAAARGNFPSAEYSGHFLDYDRLESLIQLAKLPAGTPVSFQDLESNSGEQLFFIALDREVTRISRHFTSQATLIVRSWRAVEAHQEFDDLLIPENKIGQGAKRCWQYAKLNMAAIQRVCDEFDGTLKSNKGAKYLKHLLTPQRRSDAKIIQSSLLHELNAIFQLSNAADGGSSQHDMSFFDCSFSSVWAPDLGINPNCAQCKAVLAKPVGLPCSHIICTECVSKMMKPKAAGGGGLRAGVLRQSVDVGDAACPVCHETGVLEHAMDMQALGKLALAIHQPQRVSRTAAAMTIPGKKLSKSADISASLGASDSPGSSCAVGSAPAGRASLDGTPRSSGMIAAAASKQTKRKMELWKMAGII